MRAIVVKKHGPPESLVIEDREVPSPGVGQILVRVKAVGLNHLDTWVRRGVPGHKFPLPMVPGSDITGVVESMGQGSTRFKAGDRVIINPGVYCGTCNECQAGRDHLCGKWGLLGETCDGGCQEFIVVREDQVYALPASISFEQGACIPINYVTAWQMLVGKAKIQSGESILIHAAGSGVSVAAIQIAKLFKLQIYVTSTSDEKLQHAKNLGAHRFINNAKESFRDSVRNLTGKQGVDVVVDHIGAPTMMDSIRVLKKGGRLVSCGATAGAEVTIDWKHVFFKNIALLGSTYGPREDFETVLSHFEKKEFLAVIDSVLKFDEIAKAHAMIESRKVFGKIIVTP